MSIYDDKFYDTQVKGSLNSAKEILPLIMDIVKPKSVIDVGCGLGTWLSVFRELGVADITGMDGDWVEENRLLISKENFISTDLENPAQINEKFDLAISLEVAEHISPENSEKFVKYLTGKAPVILFSAAIPHQGGVNHVNEQWPTYWINIFEKYNYQVIDCIRRKIWENKKIEVWYIQNMFLFVEKNSLDGNKILKKEMETDLNNPYSVIHPRLYSYHMKNFDNVLGNEKSKFHKELNTQKEYYEKRLDDKKRFIHEMQTSNSWKMTKFLRVIGRYLRSLK